MLIGDTLLGLPVSPTRREATTLGNGLQPFVRLRSSEGNVYSAAKDFLREVEALMRENLSRREPRELVRPWETDTPGRPISSFHTDSRYGGDLHRAEWPGQYMPPLAVSLGNKSSTKS